MPTPHPYNAERSSSLTMKQIFLASPEAECWWCGLRQPWWGVPDLNADHLAPLIYNSPRTIICRACNNLKRGVLPNTEQLSRLFHTGNIIATLPRAELKEWCQTMADTIFGGYPARVSLLLAKTGNWDIRTQRDGPPCPRSNKICENVGFSPPKG